MCSFFCAIDTERNFNSVDDLNKLTSALKLSSHRGPDHMGIKTYSTIQDTDSFNVFLGHNRLSIIDLSDKGNQPLIKEHLTIIFNGCIYNYKEIIAEHGLNQNSNSDTEVILDLYLKYGVEGINKLNGDWAFVIYDDLKKKIIVSRDRYGVKPFHIHRDNGRIYFASEMKQLVPFLKNRELNDEVMLSYLYYGQFGDENIPLLRNIEELQPGTYIEIDMESGREEKNYYWNIDEKSTSYQYGNDIVGEFSDVLTDAINIRNRADVRKGCLVSGGLDSSAIGVELNGKGVNFFSYKSEDEDDLFKQYLLDTKKIDKINQINIDAVADIDSLNKLMYMNERPIVVSNRLVFQQLVRTISEDFGIKVLISGQGADEILCGYNKYYFYNIYDLYKRKKIGSTISELIALRGYFLNNFKFNYVKRYLPGVQKRDYLLSDGITKSAPILNFSKMRDLRGRQIDDVQKYSVPIIRHYEDRLSMANIVEMRYPFLDYRVVEYCLGLENNWKVNKGRSKYVLRKHLESRAPKIAKRKDKKGFQIKEESIMTPKFYKEATQLFDKSILAEKGLINGEFIKKVISDFPNNDKKVWARDLHRFIFAEIWANQYLR